MNYDPKQEARFEARQQALGRRSNTIPSTENPDPAAAPDTDATVLGLDAAGREVRLADFRAEGFGLFRRLTSPGPVGQALMNALCEMTNGMAMECYSLGLDRASYTERARYALSTGIDPMKAIEAEISYRKAHNALHETAPFGSARRKKS